MKILAANKMDWSHPRAGGVEVNLRETLSLLSERGHEVHLLTSKYPGSSSSEMLAGVKIHRYGFSGMTNELFILTLGQLYLNYLDWKLEPDILYTTNSIAAWFSISDTPHVTAIHHIYGRSISGQFGFPVNVLGYVAEQFSLLLARSRDIISISASTTEKLVKKGFNPDKITELVNGVDTDSYTPGEETDIPRIVYLGRFEYNKGADLLPEIYIELEERLDEFVFEMAGFGRKKDIARALADGKEKAVFHGYVDEKKKKELLSTAWVVVAPSRIEGWGMTVSEAHASATPVVGFDTEGLRDSIESGSTGYLVDMESSEGYVARLADRIAELVENDKRRSEFGENARELSETRDWATMVDGIEDLFRERADR